MIITNQKWKYYDFSRAVNSTSKLTYARVRAIVHVSGNSNYIFKLSEIVNNKTSAMLSF